MLKNNRSHVIQYAVNLRRVGGISYITLNCIEDAQFDSTHRVNDSSDNWGDVTLHSSLLRTFGFFVTSL